MSNAPTPPTDAPDPPPNETHVEPVPLPRIALVGRTNVGKSTLFNRICGRRKAITDNRPGSTRDRNYAQCEWQGAGFELIDTGGLLLGSDDPLLGPAADQAQRAIEESDLVMFLVDGRSGRLPDDEAIAKQLRKAGRPVLLCVNKAENGAQLEDFARMGFERVVELSAEHGQGVGDALDAALALVPRRPLPEPGSEPVRVALVGRPNVGKSSLLNRLLGQERAVVSEVPGTTRDSVDSLVERDGKRYLVVDTAGIRRARLLKENVDHISVVQSRHAIERAEIAVVILDGADSLREMDATIAGYVQEAGRGVVLVVNKWDLAQDQGLKQKAFEQDVRDHIKFLPFAQLLFVSAKTGKGVPAILRAVDRARVGWMRRITTGELNRVIAQAAEKLAPKAVKGGAPVKILYSAQVGVRPPTFAVSINHPVDLHFSYRRYLENQLRARFDFEGTPIQIRVRFRRH